MTYQKKKKRIVVFDFDGTLTSKDTLIDFIRFVFGFRRLFWGFLLSCPWIFMMFIHLYPNEKVKERVLCHFFKGMSLARFEFLGKQFADRVVTYLRPTVVERLQKHLSQGDYVLVITASVPEWVRPLCCRLGVHQVIGTTMQVENGLLTGRFHSSNCYGVEKVNRLRQQLGQDKGYVIVYGDSRGDKALADYADEAYWVSKQTIIKKVK